MDTDWAQSFRILGVELKINLVPLRLLHREAISNNTRGRICPRHTSYTSCVVSKRAWYTCWNKILPSCKTADTLQSLYLLNLDPEESNPAFKTWIAVCCVGPWFEALYIAKLELKGICQFLVATSIKDPAHSIRSHFLQTKRWKCTEITLCISTLTFYSSELYANSKITIT